MTLPPFTIPPPFPTPDSWREQRTLHVCSFEARGLWMELLCLMHGPDEIWMPFLNKKTGRLAVTHLAILVGSNKYRIYAAIEELTELKVINPAVWDHPVIPAPRIMQRRGLYSQKKGRFQYWRTERFSS